MNFKEWLNRREMIEEGLDNPNKQFSGGKLKNDLENEKTLKIDIIKNAFQGSNLTQQNVKKYVGYLSDSFAGKNDKDADKALDPEEFLGFIANNCSDKDIKPLSFVFLVNYLRSFEPEFEKYKVLTQKGLSQDTINALGIDQNAKAALEPILREALMSKIKIDKNFKDFLKTGEDVYSRILKMITTMIKEKKLPEGLIGLSDEENKEDATQENNVEEKSKTDNVPSDSKSDNASSSEKEDDNASEEKSDNNTGATNSQFAGSREWGIPKPDKSLDYERAVESYKESLEAYKEKAIEKLEDIMGAISKRHDAAVEQENARTEANKAEADRYSNMKYTPSSITTEMFELASKYNHTINEDFLRKIKDKAIGLSKTASDKRDESRASDNSSLIDEYKKMIASKIEAYEKDSIDLLRKYKFGGKGGRVSGTKVQDGNYGLITLFINLERDLNKILDKAKKDAGPSFAQRRAKEKQEWKDYKDRLNKNSPEYQAKESRKESAANTMYNKLIDFLHREQSSDCLKILRMELIRTINDANNSEALRNVLNYGNGNQDYKIYDTKPGEYDFSKKGSLGTFGSIFDTRAGVGITQADLASLKDKDKDVWEKIKSGIRSDKVLTDAINDYNKYNNTRRRADDLLAQKMNQSTRVGTLDLNEFPKIDGTNGIQLNDSGMEDVAFRQALADKKYIVKMEGSVITYATDKNAFKKQEQIAKQNEVNTAANAGKPTENVDMQDWNSSVKTKPTATVTTAAADGLPTGLYRKVMRRKIW